MRFERWKNDPFESFRCVRGGRGDLLSRGTVREFEQMVAIKSSEIVSGSMKFNLMQERRVIRLRPMQSELTWESDSSLVLRFDLPRGTYATTLLRESADIDAGKTRQAD